MKNFKKIILVILALIIPFLLLVLAYNTRDLFIESNVIQFMYGIFLIMIGISVPVVCLMIAVDM